MQYDLNQTAQAMVVAKKGVLAADESNATIGKRFAALGLESTPASRQAYRQALFTTPGLAETTSGVILYDETFRQCADDGRTFPEVLGSIGILPGIKVDTGAKALAGHPGETVTEGLDGLRERLGEYVALGARFAKWRAVISIGEGLPTAACILANAHALARYAAVCQEAGLVPIVEPEVLMEGSHSIERCAKVTETALQATFAALSSQDVALEGMVLKPNMVVPGKDADRQADVHEVAEATLSVLRRTVPAAVAGIAFLSGGQPPAPAIAHLEAMTALGPHPWPLTFSFGRALQDPALAVWHGSDVAAAQDALAEQLRLAAAAATGASEVRLEAVG